MNENFVKLVEGYFVSKHAIYSAKGNLQMALMEPKNKGDDINTKKQELVIEVMRMVSAQSRIRIILLVMEFVVTFYELVLSSTAVFSLVEQIESRIKIIWESKLKLTEEADGEQSLPRVIRLCRRLSLTDKESMVMLYTIVCQMSETRSINLRYCGNHYIVHDYHLSLFLYIEAPLLTRNCLAALR